MAVSDGRLAPGVWARRLDGETLGMYPNPKTGKERKSAPVCVAPLGGHGKNGKKSTVALVRHDGRLLEFCCDDCAPRVAEAYASESEDR